MRFRSLIQSTLVFAFSFAALAGTSRPPQTQSAHEPLVLLVSIDGLRPDAVNAKDSPTLAALAAEGVEAKGGMTPVFPSLTFPNHYSLVTGLLPVRHGIVSNDMLDPAIPGRFSIGNREIANDPRWWIGEPIWIAAQKQGRRSGTMFWPGSEVEFQGQRPTYLVPFDSSLPNEKRVEKILEWIDLPAEQRPHFLTLYFEEVDSAGHKNGPHAEAVRAAIANVDSAMATLVRELKRRGVWDELDIVVTSDHGMADVKTRVSVKEIVQGFRGVEWVGQGALMGLKVRDVRQRRDLQKRLQDHSDLYTVYLREEIPERFAYRDSPRVQDLVILAKEGAYVTMSAGGPGSGGTHGYDNELESMRATFLARGPSIRPGAQLGNFKNLDVYSLLCRLLQIQPSANDGSIESLRGILR